MGNVLMTYQQHINQAMIKLSHDDRSVFIGYNLRYGSKGYGTMDGVAGDKQIEFPVCEDLMVGVGIGMALSGYRPVIFIERHDFLWLAMDMIVNHLDKIPALSGGQYKLPVTIRAVVGATKPLDPGPQHSGNYTDVLRRIVSFPVIDVQTADDVRLYDIVCDAPRIFVEHRERYNIDIGPESNSEVDRWSPKAVSE